MSEHRDSITVYCCDGGKRWDFHRAESGRWLMPPVRGRRYRADARTGFDRQTGRRLARKEAEYAVVGELVSSRSAAYSARYAFHYNLRCEKCKRTVPVRDEKLSRILDGVGAVEISLVELSARLSGSATL